MHPAAQGPEHEFSLINRMSDQFERVKGALEIKGVIQAETGLAMKGKHLEHCPFCGGHGCFSINEA